MPPAASSSTIEIVVAKFTFLVLLLVLIGRNAGADARRRAWLCDRSLLLEHIQHGCGRRVLELGCMLPDIERLARSHQNGDVLLAVDGVGDGRRIDAGA